MEDDIAFRSGLEPGYVAIDVPSVKLLLSEPRMAQVDVKVVGDDGTVSYTHLRAHETDSYLVCRLLLEKKKNSMQSSA